MSVLLPLWASYLVKVYAWRVILARSGLLDWAFELLGIGDVSSSGDLGPVDDDRRSSTSGCRT